MVEEVYVLTLDAGDLYHILTAGGLFSGYFNIILKRSLKLPDAYH